MKKVGKNIISQFLLIAFIAISFPIPELLHDHHSSIVSNCLEDHHHFNDDVKQKCNHKQHFSEKGDSHICFLVFCNMPFEYSAFNFYFLKVKKFSKSIFTKIEMLYLSKITTKFSRGPPYFKSFLVNQNN